MWKLFVEQQKMLLIPEKIWALGIQSICLENWDSPGLATLINNRLPIGWKFVKYQHGEWPINSILTIEDPKGIQYEEKI